MRPTEEFKIKYINPLYFLVRIDRQKQYDKRTKQGSLFIAPSTAFMAHNQQCGEIMAIGTGTGLTRYQDDFKNGGIKRVPVISAAEALPQARVGDTLLFSHIIEGSVETKDQQQVEHDLQYLAHEDAVWRYYWVKHEYAYGVVKPDGSIYATPHVILARPADAETDSREHVLVGSLYLLKNFKEKHHELQTRLDQMKNMTLEYSNKQKAREIQLEMEKLTAEKNKARLALFVPLCVNEKFHRDCGRKITDKDFLYYKLLGGNALDLQILEFTYLGKTYCVLDPEYVVAVHNGPITFAHKPIITEPNVVAQPIQKLVHGF